MAQRKAKKASAGGITNKAAVLAGEEGFSAATAEGATQLAEAFGAMLGEGDGPGGTLGSPAPDASESGTRVNSYYNDKATFDGGAEVRGECQ